MSDDSPFVIAHGALSPRRYNVSASVREHQEGETYLDTLYASLILIRSKRSKFAEVFIADVFSSR